MLASEQPCETWLTGSQNDVLFLAQPYSAEGVRIVAKGGHVTPTFASPPFGLPEQGFQMQRSRLLAEVAFLDDALERLGDALDPILRNSAFDRKQSNDLVLVRRRGGA